MSNINQIILEYSSYPYYPIASQPQQNKNQTSKLLKIGGGLLIAGLGAHQLKNSSFGKTISNGAKAAYYRNKFKSATWDDDNKLDYGAKAASHAKQAFDNSRKSIVFKKIMNNNFVQNKIGEHSKLAKYMVGKIYD